MKQKFKDLYIAWAARTAQLSHARRLQVRKTEVCFGLQTELKI